MPKLNFRGAIIRHFDGRQEESGLLTRIHVTADYSDKITEAMGWPTDLDDLIESAKLDGELVLQNFILTPNGGEELKKYEIDIPCRDASKFEVVRVQEDNEKSHVELRFQIRSSSIDTPSRLAHYIQKIGKGRGLMKADCEKQADLPLEAVTGKEVTDPQTGEVLMKGEAAEEHDKLTKRGTLPSMREMKAAETRQ